MNRDGNPGEGGDERAVNRFLVCAGRVVLGVDFERAIPLELKLVAVANGMSPMQDGRCYHSWLLNL